MAFCSLTWDCPLASLRLRRPATATGRSGSWSHWACALLLGWLCVEKPWGFVTRLAADGAWLRRRGPSRRFVCSQAARNREESPWDSRDERLLAALARHPVFTKHEGRRHPKIGFKQVRGMFHWDRIAEETGLSMEEAIRYAFGKAGKSYQFIRQRVRMKSNLPRLGLLVKREILSEEEELKVLEYLRGSVEWQPRECHGRRANFGPTLTPQYKVHRSYPLTEIPPVLHTMRQKVLNIISTSEDIRRFAMTPRVRAGNVGHSEEECFNQALLQRYSGNIRAQDPQSQTLPMHLDQRDDWAELIAGVNLGELGHIFFSGDKPGTQLRYHEMTKAQQQRKGILIPLPPRSVYIFYGFARYGLCHGVASTAGLSESYDRITVTWRSVKAPLEPTAEPPQELPAPGSEWEGVGLWGQHG